MKKLVYLIPLLTVMVACEQAPDMASTSVYPVHLLINLPISDSVDFQISEASLTITDLNMANTTQWSYDTLHLPVSLDIELPVGFYNADFMASMKIDTAVYTITAYFRNCTVMGEETFEVKASLDGNSHDFVLAEVFFAGTKTPQGKQYLGDKYFIIYNNTFDTLYADGIVLLESKLKQTTQIGLNPDFRSKSFTVDAMYRIPGNGTEVPVAPGNCLLIVDNAMDHTVVNSNSFNLLNADYEWYDVSTSASITDVDNPDIPNLDKIYCYTLTIWTPNNQGNTTFALGRLPEALTAENYLAQYKYTYDYTTTTQAGTFEMSADTYLFPNEWIIDAVNLCPSQKFQWLTSPTLDAGYAYVAATGSDANRYGKAVRRKIDFMYNNHPVLIDTNNSSNDFEMVTADPTYFR